MPGGGIPLASPAVLLSSLAWVAVGWPQTRRNGPSRREVEADVRGLSRDDPTYWDTGEAWILERRRRWR